MELNERKRKILRSIIEDYIESAEPVGSRTISRRVDIGLSSATVRNEMSDLEEMGFIVSPHTSSGRIPTDMGYRFYVNELMRSYSVANDDITRLKKYFAAGILQLDRIIQRAGNVLSDMTNYTSIAVTPELRNSYLKHIDTIPIDERSLLLILVTSDGTVKNKMIHVSVSEQRAREISSLLSETFSGKTLSDITSEQVQMLRKKIGSDELVDEILIFCAEVTQELNGSEVYVDNPQHILNHPEYHSISRAQDLFNLLLDDKKSLKNAFEQGNDSGISVVIGHENKLDSMKDTSLITAGYSLNGRSIGKIGIVGPTRMDYAKVIASLECIKKNIDDIVSEMYGSERDENGK